MFMLEWRIFFDYLNGECLDFFGAGSSGISKMSQGGGSVPA